MNNETNQVAKIAESLTPKMIEALMFQISRNNLKIGKGAIHSLYFAHNLTRNACIKRGLVVLAADGWRFWLTPLGYAVLDYLGLLSFYEGWAEQITAPKRDNPDSYIEVNKETKHVQWFLPQSAPAPTRSIESEKVYKRLLSLWRKHNHLKLESDYRSPIVNQLIAAELKMIMLEIDDLTLRFPLIALRVFSTQLSMLYNDDYESDRWVNGWDTRLASKWRDFQWQRFLAPFNADSDWVY